MGYHIRRYADTFPFPVMPDATYALSLLEDSDLICSEAQVNAALGRLADEISARLQDLYPLAVAVMGGAIVFAGQLLPKLRFPLDFDFVHATRYGNATAGGTIQWRVPPSADVRNRHVLVLDDILDGGQTMQAIVEKLAEQGAAKVYCAVLVDKLIGRPKPLVPDFVGLRVPDRFVFGCGMDAMGHWRNLPEIRALRTSSPVR